MFVDDNHTTFRSHGHSFSNSPTIMSLKLAKGVFLYIKNKHMVEEPITDCKAHI